MNFNIIDGTDDLDYDMVLQDYQNLELSVREIKEKHGITDGKWQRITKQWREQGITLRSKYHRTGYPVYTFRCKNYTLNNGRYKVYKEINGKKHYFGTYETEEEAKAKVKELWDNNWNGLLE